MDAFDFERTDKEMQARLDRMDKDGMACPFGCNVTAWRMYGMVRHLMTAHGYSEKRAWSKVHEIQSEDCG